MSSHSFGSLPIGEGVMDSSVVIRSCRILGAEKHPTTRVVPSLVSISLPNKGVGHAGMTRNLWGNICPFQQQRSAQVNLFIIVFPVAPKMVQVWWGKGSGAGDQDRVGSPCANQEILGNTCHMHLVAPLAPVQGWLSVTGGWLSGPLQSC